jgi:hypothetical protein
VDRRLCGRFEAQPEDQFRCDERTGLDGRQLGLVDLLGYVRQPADPVARRGDTVHVPLG